MFALRIASSDVKGPHEACQQQKRGQFHTEQVGSEERHTDLFGVYRLQAHDRIRGTGDEVAVQTSVFTRAGVERVMGFCTSIEYLEFMRQVPNLERMLVRSGIRLFKYWFSVSDVEQERQRGGLPEGVHRLELGREPHRQGGIGRVVQIDEAEGLLYVEYDGRRVEYEVGELDAISLAYATTVHKSQGSEYPAVVIPLGTPHYMLLERNLLYTAVTRGKTLVVVIGQRKALAVAVRKARMQRRYSGLLDRC